MAWTSVSVIKKDPQHTFVRGDGRILTCFQLNGTSAAGASGDLTLSTELTTTYGANETERLMQTIRGSSLHWVDFVAGSVTPTSQCTITIDNQSGILLFTGVVGVAGTSESFVGTLTVPSAVFAGPGGQPLTDAIIALTTLGATKTASFYFWFIK